MAITLSHTPSPKRLFTGVVISFISVIVTVLLLEGVLRLAIPPLPQTVGNIHQTSPNPRLVYELKPNSEGYLLGAPVHVNSIGLRDVEYTMAKPENVYRIVVLGDSWTFGTGVTLEQTYAKQLEVLLNELGTRRFQVMNAGIGGGNIVRAVEMLKTRDLLDYEPDLVLLGYNIHNVELGHQYLAPEEKLASETGTAGDGRAKGEAQYVGPSYGPIPYDWLYFFRENSYLANFLVFRFEAILKSAKLRDWSVLYEDDRREWQTTQAALAELASLTSQRNVPVLVAMFPILVSFNGPYMYEDTHEKIGGVVEEEGMHFADLAPRFEGIDAPALWVHPNDRHPNAEGHRILAEGIYEALVEKGVVPTG